MKLAHVARGIVSQDVHRQARQLNIVDGCQQTLVVRGQQHMVTCFVVC